MYKDARKQAGLSIEVAAAELNIGMRTLVNYEKGTSLVPADVALKMSEVYGQPHLVARYCAEQCPIGQKYANCLEEKDLATSVLGLIKEHQDVSAVRDRLIEISADGIIDEAEQPDMEHILEELKELDRAIDSLMWWARAQLQKQKPATAQVAEKRVTYKNSRATAAR